MNNFPLFLPKGRIILEKYKIIKLLEKNNIIAIYLGQNIFTNDLFTIKIEHKIQRKKGLLESESNILNILKNIGIPKIKEMGYYDSRTFISIQAKLGLTLSEIFDKFNRCFNIKDITLIALQILERIKYIHSINIIHCNISPDNLYLDFSKFQNVIYLTNFTYAIKYYRNNETKNDNKNIDNINLIFSSINSMKGIKIHKKDDLESLGYILIYFLKGRLPWEILAYEPYIIYEEKKRKICQIKKNYSIDKLSERIPEEFKLFMKYIRNLKSNEEIDYNYCFKLFYDVFNKNNIINDGIFSWYQEKRYSKKNIRSMSYYKHLWQIKFMKRKTSMNIIYDKPKLDNNTISNIINLKKSNSSFLNIYNNKYLNEKNITFIYKKKIKGISLITKYDKDYSIEGEIDTEEKITTFKRKKAKRIIKNITINNSFIKQTIFESKCKTLVNSNKKSTNSLQSAKDCKILYTDYFIKQIPFIRGKNKKNENVLKPKILNRTLRTSNVSLTKIKKGNKLNVNYLFNKKDLFKAKLKEIKLSRNINPNPLNKRNNNILHFHNLTESNSKSNFAKKEIKNKNYTIINNSIYKLNVIQNISRIYVSKSFLEEKAKSKSNNRYNIPKKVFPNNNFKKVNEGKTKNLILKIKEIKKQNKDNKQKAKNEKEYFCNDYYLIK